MADGYWQIGVIMFGVAAVAGVAFLIPALLQVRRTAREADVTLGTLNRSLPAILKNIEDITTDVRLSSASVRGQVEGLAVAIRKLQAVILSVASQGEPLVPAMAKHPAYRAFRQLLALGRAVRVFLNVYRSPRV